MPATCRVLLLGERPALLGSLATALRGQGLAVVPAQSDQLESVGSAAEGVDIVVMADDGLWADSIAVLASIRERFPDLPVIFIGRRCQVDIALRALKLGRVQYLNRPVSPRKLCDRIEDVLERQSYLKELTGRTTSQFES